MHPHFGVAHNVLALVFVELLVVTVCRMYVVLPCSSWSKCVMLWVASMERMEEDINEWTLLPRANVKALGGLF